MSTENQTKAHHQRVYWEFPETMLIGDGSMNQKEKNEFLKSLETQGIKRTAVVVRASEPALYRKHPRFWGFVAGFRQHDTSGEFKPVEVYWAMNPGRNKSDTDYQWITAHHPDELLLVHSAMDDDELEILGIM